jgi:hypothetical protein
MAMSGKGISGAGNGPETIKSNCELMLCCAKTLQPSFCNR